MSKLSMALAGLSLLTLTAAVPPAANASGGTDTNEQAQTRPQTRGASGTQARVRQRRGASMDAMAKIRRHIENMEEAGRIDRSKSDWKTNLPRFPQVQFTGDGTYYWELETNVGDLVVRFMPEVAPNHVANFLYLTELGFFDGIVFHRVIPGFMAQGGDPTGSGRGSPGYRFGGEFDESVRHDRPGLLSMANAGPGTDGSQFFLTFKATPWLDGKHTIFGEVVEGMDTLKELEKRGSRSGKTSERLVIEDAELRIEQ